MPTAAAGRLPAVRALSTVGTLPSSAPAPSETSPSTSSTTVATATAPPSTAPSTSPSIRPSSAAGLPPTLTSPFPFAAAPDIIRAHQKDAYFAGTLANDLADLVRRFGGGRAAHAWAAESQTAAELAYWGLTAGRGHRTLGEEYCDLVMVTEDGSGSGPSSGLVIPPPLKRSAYVLSSVLAPYLAGRLLPGLRRALRRRLERGVAAGEAALGELESRVRRYRKDGRSSSSSFSPSSLGLLFLRLRIQRLRVFVLPLARYLLKHLDALTSGTHARAAALALFYFYGAYYTLTTRLLGLRYVFTRRRTPPGGGSSSSEDVVGYEVLGALLVLQLAVQGYLHVRDTLASSSSSSSSSLAVAHNPRYAGPGPVEVSLDHDHTYTANNELLLGGTPDVPDAPSATSAALAQLTHTPAPPLDPETGLAGPRFDLAPKTTMRWLAGRAQRQCTLCLEVLKDPAATPCGHVFCWRCIGDWAAEKPECPLCRRAALPQHILPLRAL